MNCITNILSGDIGVFNNASDNSYHVVTIDSSIESAVLDGVTIKFGRADGPDDESRVGAAVKCQGQVELVDCTIELNYALNNGAAIFAEGDSTVIVVKDCVINYNTSGDNIHIVVSGNAVMSFQGFNQVQNE